MLSVDIKYLGFDATIIEFLPSTAYSGRGILDWRSPLDLLASLAESPVTDNSRRPGKVTCI